MVPKTGGDSNPGSHHLHDIILVTRPGATVSAAAIRQAIVSVDPRLPIESIGTLGEQVSNQFRQQRLIAKLSSFFGMLSLVLASIGLYGVTSYNVGQRTTEIGVCFALGATPAQVAVLVIRSSVGPGSCRSGAWISGGFGRGQVPGQPTVRIKSV